MMSREATSHAAVGPRLPRRGALSPVNTVAVVASALFMAHAAMAVNLTTPVNFAVTEGGSASISIPIQVVRGLAGMEPQLSLSYSSGAGNGLLGIGWTLTGPSAITRCPKNRVTDGVRGAVTFGPGDRYCLDGQRLEIISPANGNVDGIYGSDGTEYRTERDSFSRIKAYGNSTREPTTPDRFTVETKSGLILEFGRDANSRVMTKGRITGSFPFLVQTIKRWMLQRISDRQPNGGNFVEFFYCGGEVSDDGVTCTSTEGTSPPAGTAPWSGSKVLHYIRYTNHDGAINGEYGVVIRYENRPDRIQGFHAGTAARQTQRIIGIDTYRNFSGPGTGQ